MPLNSNWRFDSEPPPSGGHLPLGLKETLKMAAAGIGWWFFLIPFLLWAAWGILTSLIP